MQKSIHIICLRKAEKGFAAVSSPKKRKSFPLWKIGFSNRHHSVPSIRFDIPGEGAGILKAGLNSVG